MHLEDHLKNNGVRFTVREIKNNAESKNRRCENYECARVHTHARAYTHARIPASSGFERSERSFVHTIRSKVRRRAISRSLGASHFFDSDLIGLTASH